MPTNDDCCTGGGEIGEDCYCYSRWCVEYTCPSAGGGGGGGWGTPTLDAGPICYTDGDAGLNGWVAHDWRPIVPGECGTLSTDTVATHPDIACKQICVVRREICPCEEEGTADECDYSTPPPAPTTGAPPGCCCYLCGNCCFDLNTSVTTAFTVTRDDAGPVDIGLVDNEVTLPLDYASCGFHAVIGGWTYLMGLLTAWGWGFAAFGTGPVIGGSPTPRFVAEDPDTSVANAIMTHCTGDTVNIAGVYVDTDGVTYPAHIAVTTVINANACCDHGGTCIRGVAAPDGSCVSFGHDPKGHAAPPRPVPTAPLRREEWPWVLRVLATERGPGEAGVGDTVARILGPIGGDKFKRLWAKVVGRPCGCADRQRWLNERFPYPPP